MTTSTPVVFGMDPSLRGFGISDGERHTVFSTPAGVPIGDRCRAIVEELSAFIFSSPAAKSSMIWAIEAPLLHAMTTGASHLYEVGWLMSSLDRYARDLRAGGIELVWLEIPSPNLRKWLTGKGNAPKSAIPMQVYKRFGVEFGLSDPGADKAFAYALHRYGLSVSTGEMKHEFSALRGQGQRSRAAVRKTARTRGVA